MTARLVQKRFSRGSKTYEFAAPGVIDVTLKTLTNTRTYQIRLEELDDRIMRVRHTIYSYAVVGLIFVLAGAAVALALHNDGTLTELWAAPVCVASPAVACLFAFWRNSESYIIFKFNDGQNAIVMFEAYPSKVECEAFVTELQRKLRARVEFVREAHVCIRDLFKQEIISAEEASTLSSRVVPRAVALH